MAAATRPPAVAGTFYPADPVELAERVDALLAAAVWPPVGIEAAAVVEPGGAGAHVPTGAGRSAVGGRSARGGPSTGAEPYGGRRETGSPRTASPGTPSSGTPSSGTPSSEAASPEAGSPVVASAESRALRAVIVPHAGYRYSGPVAAAAYRRLGTVAPDRVVLVGPAHYVPVTGCVVPRAGAWRTPLGPVTIDADARAQALRSPGVEADDGPHAPEHSLEVQLPFLQRVFGRQLLSILPVAVHGPAEAIADLLDAIAADAGTLVVASTDLSHYLPDPVARERDVRTAAAIRGLRPESIDDHAACGGYALRGLLTWARRHAFRPRQLALATSADTGGDRARVVGYAAFALHEVDRTTTP